jgi:hypothetical protein
MDSKVLIQRNKNMLADVMTRQLVEKKRTQDFLKYALSKRDPIPARKFPDKN